MRVRLVLVVVAVGLSVGLGGLGGCGGHTKAAVPAGQVTTVLRQKLHVHKDQFGSDVFDLPAGRCSVDQLITSSLASKVRPGKYTAIAPDHKAVVLVSEITSGGGAPASACVQAVRGALGWS